jgi:hypothetical protein
VNATTVTVADWRGTIPDWALRLGLAAVASSLVALLSIDGAPSSLLAVLSLVAVAAVFVPASPASAILGAGVAITFVAYGDGSIGPAVLAAIPLVHLLHVLTGLVAVIPTGSRVHVRALRRPTLRFGLIQTATLTLTVLAWQLPRTPTPTLLEITALLALITAATLVAVHLTRS